MHRIHLDEGLAQLKQMLLTMGSCAEEALMNAMRALKQRDDILADQVEQTDTRMDQLEIDVDDLAITTLAHAPLASDLRLVMVAVKISHDLERVGDEATTIARRARKLNTEPPVQSNIELPRMAELATKMLRDALDAFVRGDAVKARGIVPRDKEVDSLHKGFLKQLERFMEERPDTIGRCLHLITISKSLERIADHATNIAEEVVYLYEGRDIRHSGKATVPANETQDSGR
ncbi:MAG TPA: phosphate signaling complex protein PhoU [Methylomirabilota bacterium]|nr:phosphate signaling complex protein PhoU [Methylomirabilota bacterium]